MNSDATPRYLTKSRFKLALGCPTKLFYTGEPDVYTDVKQEDEFLQALADGGFQVGELAKLMFPGGIEITSRTHDEQVEDTRRLLGRDEVTLFEVAIRRGNLFARVDVLRKTGSQIELIEVKGKSFDFTTDRGFRGARGGIDSGMKPYLQDVAFQRHVLCLAYGSQRGEPSRLRSSKVDKLMYFACSGKFYLAGTELDKKSARMRKQKLLNALRGIPDAERPRIGQ